MDPPARRATRSSAKAIASTSQQAQEFEKAQSTRKSSAAQVLKPKINDLKTLIEKPDVSVEELSKFFKDNTKKKQELLDSELWTPTVVKWINNDKPALFHFYIDMYKSYYDDALYDDDMLTTFLIAMRDANRDYMFNTKQYKFWTNFKKGLESGSISWSNFIEDTFSKKKEAYILKLIEHEWIIENETIIENISHMSTDLMPIMEKYIATKNPTVEDYKFLLHHNISKNTTPDTIASIDTFISNVIHEDRLADKLLSFQINQGYTPYTIINRREQSYLTSAEDFLTLCINKKCMKTAAAFRIDMKAPDSKKWLSYAFKRYIVYNDNSKETILRYLITTYKIDINSIFIIVEPEIQAIYKTTLLLSSDFRPTINTIMADPIVNPFSWLKQIPVLTYAILYKNTRAIKFLFMLGATFDKCAINLNSLTDDPEMLKLFMSKNAIVKAQRIYKSAKYHPDHPSQTQRNQAWEEHR